MTLLAPRIRGICPIACRCGAPFRRTFKDYVEKHTLRVVYAALCMDVRCRRVEVAFAPPLTINGISQFDHVGLLRSLRLDDYGERIVMWNGEDPASLRSDDSVG